MICFALLFVCLDDADRRRSRRASFNCLAKLMTKKSWSSPQCKQPLKLKLRVYRFTFLTCHDFIFVNRAEAMLTDEGLGW